MECLPEIGVTGHLQGGNCHGAEKVNRIIKLLDGQDVCHITAYGDSAGDREMLAYADQGCWIR
ncbi:MAG: hypothetical protein IPG66_16985 [Hydrogenophilales bacterium]|nr:hypothetical protein [Hydrogenophilales bacterium]